MIVPEQMRAGRALVGWSQADLARAAGVSEVSVKNIERGVTDPRIGTMRAIVEALEEAGVVFIPENGGGAGVRLFKENLVGWLQCESPFPGDAAGIQDRFEELFMSAKAPREFALFSRTSRDYQSEIYLLSPGAVRLAPLLAGIWEPAKNPSLFGWGLCVGHHDALDYFGLKRTRMGR